MLCSSSVFLKSVCEERATARVVYFIYRVIEEDTWILWIESLQQGNDNYFDTKLWVCCWVKRIFRLFELKYIFVCVHCSLFLWQNTLKCPCIGGWDIWVVAIKDYKRSSNRLHLKLWSFDNLINVEQLFFALSF